METAINKNLMLVLQFCFLPASFLTKQKSIMARLSSVYDEEISGTTPVARRFSIADTIASTPVHVGPAFLACSKAAAA